MNSIAWNKGSELVRRFFQADIPLRAAALAYHTILAIIPTLGILFWYLTNVGVTDRWLRLAREYITQQLNVASSESFQLHFDQLTNQVGHSGWGIVGIVVLIYTITSLVAKFGQSLDAILGTQSDFQGVHRGTGLLTLLRIGVILILPIALTVSLAVSEWVRKDSWFHFIFGSKFVGPWVAYLIPTSVNVVVYFFIYYFIPRKPVAGWEALRAALVVGPLSEMLRQIFGHYNNHAVAVHRLYGVFAVVPLVILYFQLSWMLILGGALLIRFRRANIPAPLENTPSVVPL